MKARLTRLIRNFIEASRPAIGIGTLLDAGFRLDVRSGYSKSRVTVGSNSILQCQITLEREIGQVNIGNNTFIGTSHLICAQQINIGSDVLIAWGCTIVDHNSHSISWPKRQQDVNDWRMGLLSNRRNTASKKNWDVVPMGAIHIGNKCWVGFNSIILKGVTIGEGTVIGAGSVVTHDVPAWTIFAGNPARLIREIPEHER